MRTPGEFHRQKRSISEDLSFRFVSSRKSETSERSSRPILDSDTRCTGVSGSKLWLHLASSTELLYILSGRTPQKILEIFGRTADRLSIPTLLRFLFHSFPSRPDRLHRLNILVRFYRCPFQILSPAEFSKKARQTARDRQGTKNSARKTAQERQRKKDSASGHSILGTYLKFGRHNTKSKN
jgi:hypothetical protein